MVGKEKVKQRIRIKLRAYDHRIVDNSARQIIEAVQRTGAITSGPVPLPVERSVITVLSSPHVHKNAREQFEMRVHKRLIDVYEPSSKTIDALMNLSLPAGVDVEIKM